MQVKFVGRRSELEALLELIDASHRTSAPSAALVTGEPGSGKSRLLGEVVRRAAGPRSARLVGFEPTMPVALAAAGDLVRALATVPGSGEDLNRLVFGGDDGPARDPLRIFETAHRALGGFGPLLLAIDDLQWFDDLSLALVLYLLRSAGSAGQSLAVVAAARPSRAAAAFLSSGGAELPGERWVAIELEPLGLDDGLALARSIDPDIDDAAAGRLWRRARGSPFWLEALVRRGGTTEPASIIDERLRALGPAAGALLAALAVGARPFETDELARSLGWTLERVDDARNELVARGLATTTGGRLHLAHDLIREAAAATLPASSRRRLHARFAESMEAGAGDDVRQLREALGHRHAAGLPVEALAARIISSPGRRLLGSDDLAYIASISDGLVVGSAEQLELDAGIGELASVLGEQELALERWRRVSEWARDPALRRDAEIEAARAAQRLGRASDAHAHLDRAEATTPLPIDRAVRIGALRAEVRLWLDHETAAGRETADRALALADEMVAAAGRLDSLELDARRAYLTALEAAGDGALQEERGRDVTRIGDLAIRVAAGLDQESYLSALMRGGFAFRPIGRVADAEAVYRKAWDLSRRLVLPTATIEAGHGLARVLRDMGRYEDARDVARETLALEARVRTAPRRWGNGAAVLHSIELSLGDPAGAIRALRDDAATEPDPHYRLTIHQTIALWQARSVGAPLANEVEAELMAARSDADLAGCPRCAAELTVHTAEALARIGRVDAARRELEAWERRPTAEYPMRAFWRASARAAVAAGAGDHAVAAGILEGLASDLERVGLIEDLIWARLDLGRAHLSVDRVRAVAAFGQSAELAERTGAISQARIATRALRRLGVRAWRRGRGTRGEGLDVLSQREREVARLVADGASNREIAEALVVSPKTVERHVTNVLTKLGLRNRTELAALVHGPGTGIPR